VPFDTAAMIAAVAVARQVPVAPGPTRQGKARWTPATHGRQAGQVPSCSGWCPPLASRYTKKSTLKGSWSPNFQKRRKKPDGYAYTGKTSRQRRRPPSVQLHGTDVAVFESV